MAEVAVSVVMPAHNAAATVAEAVRSVLAQTLRDFELIVIDDGSIDETARIVADQGDARIVLLRQGRKMGVAAALNRGLARASGVFVARMDADDRCAPGRLEHQVRFLESHDEVALVGTAIHLMNERGEVFDTRVRPGDDEYLQRELLVSNPICHGSVMMRRGIVAALGGYDERLLHVEDLDLWLRLAEVSRLALLSEPLYYWRVHPASITQREHTVMAAAAQHARDLAWERRLHGRDRYGRKLVRWPADATGRRLLAEHCVVWGREALRQKRAGRALALFLQAAALNPQCPRLAQALRHAHAAFAKRVSSSLRSKL